MGRHLLAVSKSFMAKLLGFYHKSMSVLIKAFSLGWMRGLSGGMLGYLLRLMFNKIKTSHSE
jgi:site-specific recombinase